MNAAVERSKAMTVRLPAVLLLAVAALLAGCSGAGTGADDRDYRQDMRDFVGGISDYAKAAKPGFLIIPQNGQELVTRDGEETGAADTAYLDSIDGIGREDLFYGYTADNVPTPQDERDFMLAFLDLAESSGVEVLVTDYCRTHAYVYDSYAQNAARGYISFAADSRELNTIPAYPADPYGADPSDVASLAQAENFLYLINTGSYAAKADFLAAVQGTRYDLVLIDLFFEGTDLLSAAEVASLKSKSGGGARLVVAYMSIGEAEDYRYYWQPSWTSNPPSWLEEENPDWPGNHKVRYWDERWQAIIYGNDGSYLKKILDAGFDGVYLDIIDAFEYFEDR